MLFCVSISFIGYRKISTSIFELSAKVIQGKYPGAERTSCSFPNHFSRTARTDIMESGP